MNEQLLQFIWKFGLYDKTDLRTADGQPLNIVHPGTQNTDAGPDFQNAKIDDGTVTMAGSVELHINAGDWNKHRHHHDKAYNNVILHVVYENDGEMTTNEQGHRVRVMELKSRINANLLSRYEQLRLNRSWIPCQHFITEIPPLILRQTMDRMATERLEDKVTHLQPLLQYTANDWEQVMFVMIARYLGASINKEPFTQLAQSLPAITWAKYLDDRLQLEALVFGQAGFLEHKYDDEYPNRLRKEYNYLKRLHGLKPLQKHEWKFLRLRPSNFPTIRLAQLAALMQREVKIFSQILEWKSVKKIQELFNVEVSDYWKTHYVFDKSSKSVRSHIGKAMINTLLINAVIPVIFAYGKYKDEEPICNHALKLLDNCTAEQNEIIKKWNQSGIKTTNAFDTQALLQLKINHCDRFRCLECALGKHILK